MRRGSAFVLASAVALAVAAPMPARACINAVMEYDEMVAALQEAEHELNDGDPHGALKRVMEVQVAMHGKSLGVRGVGLRERAARIEALGWVRFDTTDRATRESDTTLETSATTLQRLADEHPGDAARQTDLGEALARTNPVAARKILEELDGRDLMTTPYGYVALARVRAADGDLHGRDEALAKCRPMAKDAYICSLDPPPSRFARMIPYGAVAAAILALFVAARSARARAHPAPV